MEDLNILLSRSQKNEAGKTATISLGICQDIYYVQFNDGFWSEIPAEDESEARAYFDSLSFIF